MESWRKVWREGFAPLLSTKALEALRVALANDDSRLCQGVTTCPPPLLCVQDWPCEAGCLIGYCGAVELGGLLPRGASCDATPAGCATVGEVAQYFAQMCYQCDLRLGEPAGCRWLLNAWDEMPREEMLRELLPEVVLALASREELDPERRSA